MRLKMEEEFEKFGIPDDEFSDDEIDDLELDD